MDELVTGARDIAEAIEAAAPALAEVTGRYARAGALGPREPGEVELSRALELAEEIRLGLTLIRAVQRTFAAADTTGFDIGVVLGIADAMGVAGSMAEAAERIRALAD